MRVRSERWRNYRTRHRDNGDADGRDRPVSRIEREAGRWAANRLRPRELDRRSLLLGSVAAVSVLTDTPDWAPHVAQAEQIAATGVPLLNLSGLLANLPVFAVAPGLSGGPPTVAIAQPGYEVHVKVTGSAAATVPFVQVTLTWTDPNTGFPMGKDVYYMPVAELGFSWVMYGRGPTKAGELSVKVANLDPAQNVTAGVAILQNSRVYLRDEFWYSNSDNSGLTVPGFSLPTLPPDDSILGFGDSSVVPASGNVEFLCGMWQGPIVFSYEQNTGASSNLTVRLTAMPATVFSATHNILGAMAPPAQPYQFFGPRAPIKVRLVNSGTTGMTVTWSLVRGW